MNFSGIASITIPEGPVQSIAVGDRTLWQKATYKRELAYLESTGTQYIETGYTPNGSTRLELMVSGVSAESFSVSTGTWFLGARQGYLQRGFGFYYDPSASLFYFAFGNVMSSERYTTLYDAQKQIELSSNGLFVDGVKVVSATASSFTAPVPLTLFALNNNGSVISRTGYRMHFCKIWEGDVLKQDFIPVLDWDDRPCLYDKVSGELFYNAGTGEFLAGQLPIASNATAL